MKLTLMWIPALAGAALLAQDDPLSDLFGAEPEPEPNRVEVHEWGSINLVQGSDRGVIGGLTDDQGDLPPFVETWFDQPARARLPMMIEKPIIYFYSKESAVYSVRVTCPKGIPTQWYPAVNTYAPTPPRKGQPMPPMKNGRLEWNVITTPNAVRHQMPAMDDHPWWNIARDTDADVLRVSGKEEKFLFYRAASQIAPRLRVAAREGGEFDLETGNDAPVRHVYTVAVPESGPVRLRYLPSFPAPEGTRVIEFPDPAAAGAHLGGVLEAEGLFAKEAAGLVRIWQEAIFARPGLRAMYLMEPADLDAMLPITIQPAPDKLVRVMLVRMECLTPERERNIRDLVRDLGADTYAKRQQAEERLVQAGRIAQGIIRQILRESDDPEILVRLRRVIKRTAPARAVPRP